MKRYRTLLEYVINTSEDGITPLATGTYDDIEYDLYRVLSFRGAQRFAVIDSENRHIPGGERWFRSSDTFNRYVNSTHYSFYIVSFHDTLNACYGITRSQDNGTLSIEDKDGHSVTRPHSDIPQNFFDIMEHDSAWGANTEVPAEQPREEPAPAEPAHEEPAPAVETPAETPAAETPVEPAAETPPAPRRAVAKQPGGSLIDDTGAFVKRTDTPGDWTKPHIGYKDMGDHIKIMRVRNDGKWTLYIPAEIAGKPVTEIAPYAIVDLTYHRIKFPASIKEIPQRTIVDCPNLRSINVQAGTKYYAKSAMIDGEPVKRLFSEENM